MTTKHDNALVDIILCTYPIRVKYMCTIVRREDIIYTGVRALHTVRCRKTRVGLLKPQKFVLGCGARVY